MSHYEWELEEQQIDICSQGLQILEFANVEYITVKKI